MAIEDLLAALKDSQMKLEAWVTHTETLGVTPKPAQFLGATRDTPVTRQNNKAEARRKKRDLLPVTFDYFEAQGVNLMSEDLAFLRWHLPRDPDQHNAWIEHYLATWKEAMEKEATEHCKQNAGRNAANIWLRQEKR